jgi:hypothetical protein
MVTEQSKLIKNTETLEKEEQLKRVQKKIKELLAKLKAKKQKLTSLQSSIDSYQQTVFAAVVEARGKIVGLQNELKTLFQELRKAKLLNRDEKRKLRELEMDILPPAEERATEGKEESSSREDRGPSFEEFYDHNESRPDKVEDRQLRKVYLRLAAIIHPDKAQDSQQAAKMHELMQMVNAAYKSGDVAALLEIEQKHKSLINTEATANIGLGDFLKKQIDQAEQEAALLQNQFDRVKGELSAIEKSDIGKMYKDYVRLKRYYDEPVNLIIGELHETIEYLIKLKNSVTQFLETGIMPPELEEEFVDEDNWSNDMSIFLDYAFEEAETGRAKGKSRKK